MLNTKSVSVAIVTSGIGPVPSKSGGPIDQAICESARQLAKRMTVCVLGRKAGLQPESEEQEGVNYVRVPYANPVAYLEKISKKIAGLRPSVIQIENRPRLVRQLRNRHPGAKISLVLHSASAIAPSRISSKELAACLRAANTILVNGEFLGKTLRRKVPQIAHKLVVQHWGADPMRFMSKWSPQAKESRSQLLQELGLEKRKIILFAGRLIPETGAHHLLDAMIQVVPKEPDAVLLIVGSALNGADRQTDYVRKLYESGGAIPQYVRFVSDVSRDEMSKWYRIADIVAIPSASHEGFDPVCIGAMASGVPVVVPRSVEMRELIEDGTTGYLMDTGYLAEELPRYLLRLLGSPELQYAMGELAAQKVRQKFALERSAERRHELYQSLAKRGLNR